MAIAVIYLTYSIFSFFSKPVVDCLGNRWSLSLGCFFEAFHLVALVMAALRKEVHERNMLIKLGGKNLDPPMYAGEIESTTLQGDGAYNGICAIIIICAFIAGIGTSLLWVAHGRYVTLCADESNKGFFNSVFWVFMMACQVIGNVLGGTIITKYKQSTFFTGFTILALIAAIWMIGLPTPKAYPDDDDDKEVELVSVKAPEAVEADPESKPNEVVIPAENDAITEDPKAAIVQDDNKDVKEEAKIHPFIEMWRFLKTPRFMTFAPIVFFAGISMAVYAGLLIPMLARSMPKTWPEERKTSQACFAMIGIGAGEILGSLFNGKLNDVIGIKKYLFVCYAECAIAFAFLFWYNTVDTFTIWNGWFAAITAFWWGVQDAGITNFFLCIVGFQFGKNTTAFSALRFVQAFAIGSFTLIESLVKDVTTHNIYFGVLFAFATFAWWFFHFKFDIIEKKAGAASSLNNAPGLISEAQVVPAEAAAEKTAENVA